MNQNRPCDDSYMLSLIRKMLIMRCGLRNLVGFQATASLNESFAASSAPSSILRKLILFSASS